MSDLVFDVERVWEKGPLRTSLPSSSSSNLWRLAITGSAGEEDDSDPESEPEPEPELVSSSLSSSSVQKKSRSVTRACYASLVG